MSSCCLARPWLESINIYGDAFNEYWHNFKKHQTVFQNQIKLVCANRSICPQSPEWPCQWIVFTIWKVLVMVNISHGVYQCVLDMCFTLHTFETEMNSYSAFVWHFLPWSLWHLIPKDINISCLYLGSAAYTWQDGLKWPQCDLFWQVVSISPSDNAHIYVGIIYYIKVAQF